MLSRKDHWLSCNEQRTESNKETFDKWPTSFTWKNNATCASKGTVTMGFVGSMEFIIFGYLPILKPIIQYLVAEIKYPVFDF